MMGEQPQQQQYPHQQHSQQQTTSPVPPTNVYQPPALGSGDIQPIPPAHDHYSLPPSYDQVKATSHYGFPAAGLDGSVATVVPLNMLGNQPQWIDCPFCRQRTKTEIHREGSSMQIFVGIIFCLICVCLTCIPCLAGWFEDVEYRCSQCKNMVARRRHDGPIEVLGPARVVALQYNQQPQMNAYSAPPPQQYQSAPVHTQAASSFARQPEAQPQEYEMQPQHSLQQDPSYSAQQSGTPQHALQQDASTFTQQPAQPQHSLQHCQHP